MLELDHLVYGTADLERTVRDLEARLGVRPVPGGRHPRWGTRNALLGLGERTYLEVVAPDPARERPGLPTLFGLDRLEAPRLVAWAARARDLEARWRRAREGGARLGQIQAGSRETPDGTSLSWRLTDPEVVLADGLVPFLIDWGDTPHPGGAAPRAGTLVELRARHPAPERVRELLGAVGARLDVAPGPEPALVATIRTGEGRIELR